MNAITEAMPTALVGLCVILIVALGVSLIVGFIRDWLQERSIRKAVSGIDTRKPGKWTYIDLTPPYEVSIPPIDFVALMDRRRSAMRKAVVDWLGIERRLWKEPSSRDPMDVPYGISYFLDPDPPVPVCTLDVIPFGMTADLPYSGMSYTNTYSTATEARDVKVIAKARQQAHTDSMWEMLGRCCAPPLVVIEEMLRGLDYDYSIISKLFPGPVPSEIVRKWSQPLTESEIDEEIEAETRTYRELTPDPHDWDGTTFHGMPIVWVKDLSEPKTWRPIP